MEEEEAVTEAAVEVVRKASVSSVVAPSSPWRWDGKRRRKLSGDTLSHGFRLYFTL